MFKKVILMVVFLVLVAGVVKAQDFILDEKTKNICNRNIENFLQQIVPMKRVYKELVNLDVKKSKLNQYGLRSFEYNFVDVSARQPLPYELKFDLVKMDDVIDYAGREGFFERRFPILGLKLIGFVNNGGRSRYYHPEEFLDEYTKSFMDLQQQYLPYQLLVTAEKDIYAVDEEIMFKMIIRNNSNKILRFKDLNENTVYFLYDGKPWGVKRTDATAEVVEDFLLKPGKSRTNIFKGEAFSHPKDVEIECIYAFPYKGVRPSGMLKVKIISL